MNIDLEKRKLIYQISYRSNITTVQEIEPYLDFHCYENNISKRSVAWKCTKKLPVILKAWKLTNKKCIRNEPFDRGFYSEQKFYDNPIN